MSEIAENLPHTANDNGAPKSELGAHFEEQIQKPETPEETRRILDLSKSINFFGKWGISILVKGDPNITTKVMDALRNPGEYEVDNTPLAQQSFDVANNDSAPLEQAS